MGNNPEHLKHSYEKPDIKTKLGKTIFKYAENLRSPEQSKQVIEYLGHDPFVQDDVEQIWQHEREKTVAEIELIYFANDMTNKILLSNGCNVFDFPESNIHIIPKDDWKGPENGYGVFKQETQSITLTDTFKSKLSFTIRAIHEMLHAKSFSTIEIHGNGIKRPHQLGLAIWHYDSEGIIGGDFSSLNEAITESTVIKYYEKYKDKFQNNAFLKDEIEETDSMKQAGILQENLRTVKIPSAEGGVADVTVSKIGNGLETKESLMDNFYISQDRPQITDGFGYGSDRKNLEALISAIGNKTELNKEYIFDLFEQAMLDGNTNDLELMIEQIYGQGAFLQLGKLSATPYQSWTKGLNDWGALDYHE